MHLSHITCTLEKGIHVKFPTCRTMSQKAQDAFQPSHQLAKQPVIVDVYLVHEFVKVVLVACTDVDECLDGLIGICRHILPLALLNDADCVVGKGGEIGDGVVYICGFVYADERLIENGEKITEERQCGRFLNDALHHSFVTLASVQLEQLLERRKELDTLTHFFVNLRTCLVSNDERWKADTYKLEIITHAFDRTVPGDIGIEYPAYLRWRQLRCENL